MSTLGVTVVYDVLALPYWLEMVAVTFGALSGALHATRKGLDLVGVFALALVTGVGGGIVRDVLLQSGVPVFLRSPAYLGSAVLAAVVAVVLARLVRQALPVMGIVDTLLIGVWVVLGAERALHIDLSLSAAAFLGVLTAIGGGLVRDLLVGEVPTTFLPGQWYASAAIASATAYVLIVGAGGTLDLARVVAVVVAAGLRAASVQWNWRTPTAYDVWADLEERVTRGLASARDARADRT